MKLIILLPALMASLGAFAAPLPADTANPDGLCTVGTSAFGCSKPVTKRTAIVASFNEPNSVDAPEVDAIKRSEVNPDGLCTVGTSAFGCSKPVTK